MGFTLMEWAVPKRQRIGVSDRRPVYADCADCGSVGPSIGGHIQDESGVIAITKKSDGRQEFAFFCVACTRERWLKVKGGSQ